MAVDVAVPKPYKWYSKSTMPVCMVATGTVTRFYNCGLSNQLDGMVSFKLLL